MKIQNLLFTLVVIMSPLIFLSAQDLPTKTIQQKIELFKNNPRGPYKSINWFCEDGTIREAKDPCPGKLEGVQHASYRDDTKLLADKHHLFFGEILANTNRTEFWDEKNHQSRLKQYQLNRYLESVDNGWIQRKSQFYRGALQIEDEQEWGVEFFQKFLPRDSRVQGHYYLLRQSLRDVPHDGDTNLAQLMRSQSKTIADEFPKFMDARIKIHGNPTVHDIEMVRSFYDEHRASVPEKLQPVFTSLQETMVKVYAPTNTAKLREQIENISKNAPIRPRLLEFVASYDHNLPPNLMIGELADILCVIRMEITDTPSGNDRLLLLDLSNAIEDILLRKSQEWEPESINGLMDKIRQLSLAAAGTGLIELWEWKEIESHLETHLGRKELTLDHLNDFLFTARGVVEWSAAMVKATYGDVVDTYTTFEPLTSGFIDDRIRSSVALDLGGSVSKLGNKIAEISSISNDVMNIKSQSNIRGLNPGYAYGELVVVEGSPENLAINPDKIYIFQKPPSDLKPVAGIMTVSEGNLVSHVQLLARNLGIPNAALSDDNLKALKKYAGEKVFYAVSGKGNVILKLEDKMNASERELFSKKERNKNKIAVPVEGIRLDVSEVLNMRDIDASDSGKLCGPKAANLGQLKSMFPNNVVEGVIIPFGIFRSHMDQSMPGVGMSYWQFLNETFTLAESKRSKGVNEGSVEDFQLTRLEKLRMAIVKMPLDQGFVKEFEQKFKTAFGDRLGRVPVFLRSDTNMEDLKEFTGAGLNLTLFNILSSKEIMEGIKKVWASPYTERSFKWRQKYLSNPENVFPSILIIPSVDVEYSGVLITKGINRGNEEDLTIAFSRGAGGAVDGQIAETRLITKDQNHLLAPAREANFLRLPSRGGTTKNRTTFETAIINDQNIADIQIIAQQVRTKIASETQSESKGAWDVELGFKENKLWLFQIRPFVENQKAKSSEYLRAITPKIDYSTTVNLNTTI